MKSDSVPAFALEKEALKTEIEAGIQTGVEQMESGQKGKCKFRAVSHTCTEI